MLEMTGRTTEELDAEARRYSASHFGEYVLIVACFGPYIVTSQRLNIHSPTDSNRAYYWLNGKQCPFTKAQRIADQNASMGRE